MNDDSPIVAVSSLCRAFEAGSERLEVLADVNLEVPQGSTVAITGESGCGKSTLLSLIGGLDRPSAGSIVVDGREISSLAESELSAYRNQTIGFIFQFHFLLKDFTALENVMLPGMLGSSSARALRERARTLLADVGLEKRRDAYPLELSGGERQRVAVARALINSPPLILADEPTGNLDERNARNVEEMLFSLAQKLRRTMIIVTHDAVLAGRADRRLLLSGGALKPA